ncbi:hypothetical protein MAUB_38570 [Mycolicibacterium aubagnense]|uniref:Uncharacterized protein n=1 Tax=Mycolicibacterium aubagnense TaxID=319707 RepID=A0ABN5YZ03_9MYCO|nr:hypothetical protein MAUB_38570 [Mycolicibacterium aubagnense]
MTVTAPDSERQATISSPKYFMACTAPMSTWSDQATWNHPVGFVGNCGLAMTGIVGGSVKLVKGLVEGSAKLRASG